MKKKKREYWSDQDIEKLRSLYPDNTTFSVAKMLSRTLYSVNGMAFNLGLKKSEKHLNEGKSGRIKKGERRGTGTEFKKGNKPHNLGKKLDEIMSKDAKEKVLRTAFKKGRLPHNTKHDGIITIRTDKRGVSYQWIRLGVAKWLPLYHHVWIEANGPIPKGHVLIFKDRNTMNSSLDNIMLISKIEHCKRNSIARIPLEVRQTMTALKKLKKLIEEKK